MKIVTIGRKGTDINLQTRDDEISRLHAELTTTDDGRYYLVDCGSSNGTEVRRENGWSSIKQEYVQLDDQVRFGGGYTATVRDLLKEAT
jgi:pSer/pThr/pTyr-binding forkhead associated (FHA) protein